MKNTVIKISALVVMLLSVTSCEDMIEVKPQSQITGQVYFQSEGDYAPYLTGIYAQFRGLVNNVLYGTERSEELVAAINSRFNAPWNQTISPSNQPLDYTPWYSMIGNANLLLKRIEGQAFSNENTKKQIQAETYCLRAYTYFHLSRIAGDVPLILSAVENEAFQPTARIPAADVLKQVFADLDLAIGLFPTDGYQATKYRFNKPSAYALKAEVKLWNAKVNGVTAGYADAIAAVQKVETSGVSLVSNFRNITSKLNSEIVMSVFFDRNETTSNMYSRNALIIVATVLGADNLNDLATAASVSNAQSAYQVSPKSRALFTFPADKRIPVTYLWQLQGGVQTFAWPNKFRGTKYAEDRFADDDVILFRLADLYLIAAEAYTAQNNPTQALVYLNKVRSRAGIPDYANTAQPQLEREIFDERGRELYFENKRWYDLVRAHKAGTIDAYQYVPNLVGKTTPLYWPISPSMIALNPLLKQTDGY
jgi:starch-binding outer membrane protein, SusD/RagB family